MTAQAFSHNPLPLAELLRLGPTVQSTPLPDWAAFLLNVGEHLACLPRTSPTTVAVSVPTRYFAAALVATGAAFGCRHDEPNAFYDELFDLPLGTPVEYYGDRWRDDDKTQGIPGSIVEKSKPGEQRFLKFKRNHSTFIVQIPEQRAYLLRPEPTAAEKSNAFTIDYRSSLHRLLLKECDPIKTLFAPRKDVLLVGVAAALRDDLSLTVSAVQGSRFVQGQLHDLVNVCDWHPNGNCGFLGTQLTGDTPPDLQALQRYPVVVFDGPVGYRRWRDDLRQAHHVVIVDRTSAHLDTAMTVVQDDHFIRDTTADERAALPFPRPDGVEALAFQRRT